MPPAAACPFQSITYEGCVYIVNNNRVFVKRPGGGVQVPVAWTKAITSEDEFREKIAEKIAEALRRSGVSSTEASSSGTLPACGNTGTPTLGLLNLILRAVLLGR